MLTTTNAIVLTKLRYKDNDLIVKCYTQKQGIVSYLLKGILASKKSNKKNIYFLPLSQLQLNTDYKSNRSLQYIKDIKTDFLYTSLHTHILKSAIVMFLAEILAQALQEEEQNDALFSYLQTTLQWLDTNDNFSNFHLLFLLELTKYLGFYPDQTHIKSATYFNLYDGEFQQESSSKYCVSGENLTLLKQLLGITFDDLHSIKINAKQRQSFLALILVYFELHLGNFKKPKSLQILNDVFN
ncbi:DNA repair protein RecO [Olleya sp. YS]|uniref:DNA repair protein RecO n=1 Tax=Olleya sp. YS TaxID=3028318 RepID=UPI002434664B|nr:DNA repair protein RecO [Olleya sp. YS]WGD35978.1 DNA repair protein RecO [Olleya sp. YS]